VCKCLLQTTTLWRPANKLQYNPNKGSAQTAMHTSRILFVIYYCNTNCFKTWWCNYNTVMETKQCFHGSIKMMSWYQNGTMSACMYAGSAGLSKWKEKLMPWIV